MLHHRINRRAHAGDGAAVAATAALPRGSTAWAAAAQARELQADDPAAADRPRPNGCSGLAKARALMEPPRHRRASWSKPGPSLDYFTGVQWWRSERLTGVVIPVQRRPDHRHAFLRAAVDRGDAGGPGRDPHLAGG